MTLLADKLKTSFHKSKDYRHGYSDEFLNAFIATQIKVLREQREWTQQRLAEDAGMKQPRISAMENVNYSSWSLNVLRRLAEAFDLTLTVSFEEFGKRIYGIDRFNREALERFSFDEDPAVAVRQENVPTSALALQAGLNKYQPKQQIENGKKLGDNVVILEEYKRVKQKAMNQALEEGKPTEAERGANVSALSLALNQ